jgi:hypothetical protein
VVLWKKTFNLFALLLVTKILPKWNSVIWVLARCHNTSSHWVPQMLCRAGVITTIIWQKLKQRG